MTTSSPSVPLFRVTSEYRPPADVVPGSRRSPSYSPSEPPWSGNQGRVGVTSSRLSVLPEIKSKRLALLESSGCPTTYKQTPLLFQHRTGYHPNRLKGAIRGLELWWSLKRGQDLGVPLRVEAIYDLEGFASAPSYMAAEKNLEREKQWFKKFGGVYRLANIPKRGGLHDAHVFQTKVSEDNGRIYHLTAGAHNSDMAYVIDTWPEIPFPRRKQDAVSPRLRWYLILKAANLRPTMQELSRLLWTSPLVLGQDLRNLSMIGVHPFTPSDYISPLWEDGRLLVMGDHPWQELEPPFYGTEEKA